MELDMTDEQMDRVNRALKGEEVDLTDEEASVVENTWKMQKGTTPTDFAMDTLSKTGKNLGTVAKGLWESAKKVPGGVAKLRDVSPEDFAAEMSLEALPFAPIVSEAVAGLAGLGGAAYGAVMPGETAGESGVNAMEYVRQARAQRLAEIDPEVRAALTLGGAMLPTGALATGAEIATPMVQSALDKVLGEGDTADVASDVAADVLTAGISAVAPTVGLKGAGVALKGAQKVLPSAETLARGIGRLQGINPASITEYANRAQDIRNATSLGSEAQKLKQRADILYNELTTKQAKLTDVQNKFKEAEAVKSADAAQLSRQVAEAKAEVDAIDSMYSEALAAEQATLSKTATEAGDVLGEARKGVEAEYNQAKDEIARSKFEAGREADLINKAYDRSMAEESVALKRQEQAAKAKLAEEEARFAEAQAIEKGQRTEELSELKASERNVDPEMVDAVNDSLVKLREQTSQAAVDQMTLLEKSGASKRVSPNSILDYAKSLSKSLKGEGVVPTAKSKAVDEFLSKWDVEGIRDTNVQPKTLLQMRQDLDDLIDFGGPTGAHIGAGSGALSQIRKKANDLIDESVAGSKEVRATLARLAGIQSQMVKAFGRNPEALINRLGKRGGDKVERQLSTLQSASGVDLMPYIERRKQVLARIDELKKAPNAAPPDELIQLRAEAQQLTDAIVQRGLEQRITERPMSDADKTIADRSSEQRMLYSYLRGLSEPLKEMKATKTQADLELEAFKKEAAAPRPEGPADVEYRDLLATSQMRDTEARAFQDLKDREIGTAQTDVNTANLPVEELGIPVTRDLEARSKWANELVRKGDLEGQDSKLQVMEKTDPGLTSRIRDARIKEDIFGRVPAPLGVGQMGMGALPALRSGIRAAGGWLAAAPIDLRNKLSRIDLKPEWIQQYESAYAKWKDKAFPLTHYLLQQTDPEYSEAVNKED